MTDLWSPPAHNRNGERFFITSLCVFFGGGGLAGIRRITVASRCFGLYCSWWKAIGVELLEMFIFAPDSILQRKAVKAPFERVSVSPCVAVRHITSASAWNRQWRSFRGSFILTLLIALSTEACKSLVFINVLLSPRFPAGSLKQDQPLKHA